MKRFTLCLLFLSFSYGLYAQIRLTSVDPVNDQVTIKNFGSSLVDISGYRFCALFQYTTNLSSLTVESGNLNLAGGAEVTLAGWPITSGNSDFGLYLPTGPFSATSAMVDFTQWGSGGNGRESVAVEKGIWSSGDHLMGNAPYTYTGSGIENGLTFWQTALNIETDIISFTLSEQISNATIDAVNHTVQIGVFSGTSLANLTPIFSLSNGATAKVNSVNQVSGTTTNDFTNPVSYEIIAEDGLTNQTWIVTVEIVLNGSTNFMAYSFNEQATTAVIDVNDKTMTAFVNPGTSLSALVATFTLDHGASATVNSIAQVSGSTPNDFSAPVIYTVTAEDGINVQDWTVVVTVDVQTNILTFSFLEEQAAAIIDNNNRTIMSTIGPGTAITNLIAIFTLSDGATATINAVEQVSGTTANNFSTPLTYTITSAGGAQTVDWTVSVAVALNIETDIVSFSFPEQIGAADISTLNHEVNVEVANATNVAALVASFTLSEGASASISGMVQTSGITVNNFESPGNYNIMAEDGVTNQDWTVNVSAVKNDESDILAFGFVEQTEPATINGMTHTIEIKVASEADPASLVASFELSPGAIATVNSVIQVSGVSANNFTTPLIYCVGAENGATLTDWTVTVIQNLITGFLITELEPTFSIYPNPVIDYLSIENGPEVSYIESMKLYDKSGHAIQISFENKTLDLRSLSPGIYYLSIKSAQSSIFRKLIKN